MIARQDGGKPKKTENVSLWLSLPEKQALEKTAERLGDVGKSAVIRIAVREYLGRQVEQTANA